MRLDEQRPDPVPVFTEMTSVNPTFILPYALAARGAQIGDGFVERMLVNVGQACLSNVGQPLHLGWHDLD